MNRIANHMREVFGNSTVPARAEVLCPRAELSRAEASLADLLTRYEALTSTNDLRYQQWSTHSPRYEMTLALRCCVDIIKYARPVAPGGEPNRSTLTQLTSDLAWAERKMRMAEDEEEKIDCAQCGAEVAKDRYQSHLDECDVKAELDMRLADEEVEAELEDTFDDSMDGDAETALESVYGPDNCAEDW